MILLNKTAIEKFALDHADAGGSLNTWSDVASSADRRNILDMKQTFNSTDYVPPHGYVFNVGKNRIVAKVTFKNRTVSVEWVKTHPEYDKWNKK